MILRRIMCIGMSNMAELHLHDVSVRFGGLQALAEVNFSLMRGDCGADRSNGAGKTTVFNVITGVYSASGGHVEYNGENLTGLKPYQVLHKGIARTFQNIRLFQNMTALENVMVAQHSRSSCGVFGAIFRTPAQKMEEARIKEKAMEELRFAELDEYADEWRPVFHTVISAGLRLQALASEPSSFA